jgi:hypothetical protein
MFDRQLTKNSSKSNLNSQLLRELLITLDEQNEELLSGGAKEKFHRTKPHVNDFGSSSPYEGCDPGTCC